MGFEGVAQQNCLIHQKEVILEKLEDEKISLGISTDFPNTFDCLNHETLSHNLDQCGVREQALDLIRTYVRQQNQYVVIDGDLSYQNCVMSGVPQGRILGPLAFNIYIIMVLKVVGY